MDVQLVPDAHMDRGDHRRVAVDGERDMAQKCLVEYRVDCLPIVARSFWMAPNLRAIRWASRHTIRLPVGYNNSIGLPATAERHDGGRGDVHPVFTVEARKIPAEILAVMLEQGVHHVPIIDN